MKLLSVEPVPPTKRCVPAATQILEYQDLCPYVEQIGIIMSAGKQERLFSKLSLKLMVCAHAYEEKHHEWQNRSSTFSELISLCPTKGDPGHGSKYLKIFEKLFRFKKDHLTQIEHSQVIDKILLFNV